jgi:HlyD family secretion protein
VSQARTARDTGAAELRAAADQVALKAQTAGMAEAEVRMAEADLANAEAAVEQQQAACDQAKVDLDRSVLRAPIDGVIIKRDVSPGQTVAVALEAKTLFTIANDLSRMEVHGKIDEADIGKLRVGQTVRFTVDAYPERDFSGAVLQIRRAPESTQNVVTYTAIISAPNPDLLLYPGMTATLRIIVESSGEVLKVPLQALHFHPPAAAGANAMPHDLRSAGVDATATIWVLGPDGRPTPIRVATGLSDESGTEVRSGPLAAGQQIVVATAEAPSSRGYFGLRLGF